MIASTLWLVAAALLVFVGSAFVALSQDKHWRTVTGGKASNEGAKHARSPGFAMLVLALGPCVVRDSGAFAAIVWPLLLSLGAFCTAMALAYRPRLLKPIAMIVRKR